MNSKQKIRIALLVGAIVTGSVAPAFAANFNSLPQPVHEGNVTYISGGIGSDEEQALQSEAKSYNLQITNANKAGDFTIDDSLVIESKDGREIISANDAGPLFYAKLPPGEYKVEATSGDHREIRNIKISYNHNDHLHLIWQQS